VVWVAGDAPPYGAFGWTPFKHRRNRCGADADEGARGPALWRRADGAGSLWKDRTTRRPTRRAFCPARGPGKGGEVGGWVGVIITRDAHRIACLLGPW